MIISNAKQRLMQYLEYKKIKRPKFYAMTGIGKGFLDTDKLSSAISHEQLSIIIAKFTDLNIIWIITGNGEMLLDEINDKDEQPDKYLGLLEDKVKLLEENKIYLQKEITKLKEENAELKKYKFSENNLRMVAEDKPEKY